MKQKIPSLITAVCLAIVVLALSARNFAADASKDVPVYNESADANREINDAVATAAKEHKHVLLQFGANWCIWCHRLHNTFTTDPQVSNMLAQHFIVVLVDVNKHHNQDIDARYGQPTRLGLPVLVVLDGTGKQITTKNSGELEEGDHHSPAKILAFLQAES